MPAAVVGHAVGEGTGRARAVHLARAERALCLGHYLLEGATCAVWGDELHLRVHPLEAALGHAQGGLGGLAAEAHHGHVVLVVLEAPVLLAQHLLCRLLACWRPRATECLSNDRLARHGGGAAALGILGELSAPLRRLGLLRGRVALLERRLAVLDHVEVHEGRAGDVEKEVELDEERCPAPNKGGELSGAEGGNHGHALAGDARGIEHGEEGVAQPEDGIDCAFRALGTHERVEVKGIPGDLHQRPREGHEAAGPVGCHGRRHEDHTQGHDTGHDLHEDGEDRAAHRARERVDNLEEHGPLDDLKGHMRGAPDLGQVAACLREGAHA
mmetsp:Transcript_11725/g.28571  ORF Transcript_11725/g.28571 Transcript_11725/m.28571 type:complete len:328 (-) Transcript_11725:127-1110(-)